PHACGLCPDHEQHSCLPIIEITNHCNLECPVCIVQNRDNYHMSLEEFAATIDGLSLREASWTPSTSPAASPPFIHGSSSFSIWPSVRRSRASRSRPTGCGSPATWSSAASWPAATSN